MNTVIRVSDHPLLVFIISFLVLSLAARFGGRSLRQRWPLDEAIRGDFGVILTAALTLMGLILGFAFSMAMTRYDQRKNYEAVEANVIGTEFVRADLLPTENAAKVRALLKDYTDQRVLFYITRDAQQLSQINARTAQLQNELWSAVVAPTSSVPTAVGALAVSGMNNVLDSLGYTQAAWWNRIPVSAWMLMSAIALSCHLMIGYGARNERAERMLSLIMPLIVSISFFLIADIDSPRHGIIRVQPENLLSLAESLHAY